MSWRKWLVRGLVFSIAGAVAGTAFLYQRWTNPVAIRQQVLVKLRELFPGADVTLDSARLEILGGIRFSELRLVRRADPERSEIIYVPSGVLYHDKEQLLEGKLAIRKVELDRLRLHVTRGGDGHWNLEGVVAPAKPGMPLPTLVVHQGTFVLEDRLGPSGIAPIEINNATLTMLNDPLSTVVIEGTGTSEAVGALTLQGTWQRDTHDVSMQARAAGVPLSPALARRAVSVCPEASLDALQVSGKADIEAELAYRPLSVQSFRYDVHCRLKQVAAQHSQLLPVALENLDANLRCTDGKLTLENLSARAGRAELQARGTAALPCPASNFEGELTVKHLGLCDALFDRLPALKKLNDLFEPRGPVTLDFQCVRRAGRWEHKHCLLHPESIAVRFSRFPYPLERLTGMLDVDLLENFYKMDLGGYSATQPVLVKGTWKGAGEQADVKIDITANDIPIEEKLIVALPPVLQKLARSFHATGRGDCVALVRHTPGTPAPEFANEYQVKFKESTVKWDEFPYPVETVSGVLEIHPKYWEFHDFQGTHHGGTVTVRGRSFPRGDGAAGAESRMQIELEGRNINLDTDLGGALQKIPGLVKAWNTFAPAGRMSFAARIDRAPGQPQDLDVAVNVRGCSIEPHFFKWPLHELEGQFRYARNRVSIAGVSARHNATRVTLGRGVVDLAPGGGFYADLADLQANPVVPDDEFVKALPPMMKAVVTTLKLKDPAAVKTRLVVSQDGDTLGPPDVYWDGQLWLRDATLQAGIELDRVTGTMGCTGRHDGRVLLGLNGNVLLDQATCYKQPFRNVHAKLQIAKDAPDALLVGLKAPLFGGEISGQARVELGSHLRYELDLTASQVNLQEFGSHNLGPEPKLSGLVQGRLYLTGQGTGVDNLDGHGRLDVPEGKLIRLPLLLDLLKFLGLRWPDRTAFQEAHAVFGIHGKRVQISQLDLLGNPVSLSGAGAVDLDGSDLQMNFYPTWGRTEQLLPPMVRTVPSAISKNLLKIEVRGKVGTQPGDLQFTKKPVPILTDPLYQMRDRMTGKAN
jgi:hypothetical protein